MIVRISLALLILSTHAFAIPDEIDFSVIDSFPQPAGFSSGVIGAAAPDGRLIIWDGDTVFRQTTVGGGVLETLATGYIGDPGFITLNAIGDKALLGQGYGDGTNANLYVIDLTSPTDFVSGQEIVVASHFSGVFLSPTLVAFDRGDFGFPAEIIVLDIGAFASRSTPRVMSVLQMPAPPANRANIITKPGGSFSASLAVNGGLLYVADSGNGQYKTFAVADVINAFNTVSTLTWASGTDIGTPFQYPLGGVGGVTPGGNLVIAGFGSIVEVNPGTGAIVKSIDPAGTGPFYGMIYNPTLDDLIAIEFPASFGDPLIYHTTAAGFPALPAQSALGLIVLVACILGVGTYRYQFRRNRAQS